MKKLLNYLFNIKILQGNPGFGHSYAPKDFHLFKFKN